jgi:hypothetical protein
MSREIRTPSRCARGIDHPDDVALVSARLL